MKAVVVFSLLACFGCRTENAQKRIEKGFERLSRCIDRGTGEAIFEALDQESQWSVHTIYKLTKEMSRIVESSYPPDRREEALGMWQPFRDAPTPEALFGRLLGTWGGVAGIRTGFAVIRSAQVARQGASVTTKAGRAYDFRMGPDGRWGLAEFHDRLEKLKLMAQDHLAMIRDNALAFRKASEGEGDHAASP